VTLIDTTERLAHISLHLIGYQSRMIPTSVGRVHVLDGRGDGTLPTVVLLHGFSAAAIHYATLMRRLRPHVRRIVVPDFPAHGRSATPKRLTPATIRQGLFEALDTVLENDEPAVFFGNSMGGHAALIYADTRPERVAGMMLVSPGGGPLQPAEMATFARRFTVDNHAEALQFVDRLFARNVPLRQLVAWGLRQKLGAPKMRALLASLTTDDLLDPSDLRRIAVPTLVLWGRADTILPSEHREFFRQNLPSDARLEEPDGYGHSPYLDAPREVGQRLLAFAADVDGARKKGRRPAAAIVA
jgi:pimeloyl-ACP methyl ester carboxylesterase